MLNDQIYYTSKRDGDLNAELGKLYNVNGLLSRNLLTKLLETDFSHKVLGLMLLV